MNERRPRNGVELNCMFDAALLLLYDVTSKASFDNISVRWLSSLFSHFPKWNVTLLRSIL